MNNNLTELVYIIDMSGSMTRLRDDTIGGYNTMLSEQRKLTKDNPNMKANVTTVLFDDRYIVLHDREDLSSVRDITEEDYAPLGMTAMLDAIGKTFVSVGQKLAATPEAERPALVSVTIITDGYENASKEYSWKQIRDMIKEQREKYSWVISFLGANIDVEKTAEDLGLDMDFAKTYTADAVHLTNAYMSVSQGLSNLRTYTSTTDSLDANTIKTVLKSSLDQIS